MKFNKKITISVITCILFLLSTNVVFATTSDHTNVKVLIQGGPLGIITPKSDIDFGTVSISGGVQKIGASLGMMTVSDLTGTGNGWNITVEATQLKNNLSSLPMNSLRLEGIKSIVPSGTTSRIPTIIGTGPYVLDNGSATKILGASRNEGMGKYYIDFLPKALTLTIDTGHLKSMSSEYKGTITWTVVTGP